MKALRHQIAVIWSVTHPNDTEIQTKPQTQTSTHTHTHIQITHMGNMRKHWHLAKQPKHWQPSPLTVIAVHYNPSLHTASMCHNFVYMTRHGIGCQRDLGSNVTVGSPDIWQWSTGSTCHQWCCAGTEKIQRCSGKWGAAQPQYTQRRTNTQTCSFF